jgi:hypothetical protein
MDRRSREISSSAGSEKMEEVLIDREKRRGIVRQAKAQSGL